MKLRFNNPDEFLAELQSSPPNSEPILRATIRRQLDRQTGVHRHVTVVASYLRCLAGDYPLTVVVLLETYQGEDWGREFPVTTTTLDQAKALLDRLQETAVGLRLQFRSGIYEP